jgi:hypothetical protein
MMTHDLRMVHCTDRVIQTRDGQIAHIMSEPHEIAAITNSGTMEPPTIPNFAAATQSVLAFA